MPGRWIALLVGGVSLIGILVLLQPRSNEKIPAGASASASELAVEIETLRDTVARLEAELARAHASSRAMEDEIDWLREEVRDAAAGREGVDWRSAAPEDVPDEVPDAEDEGAEDAAPGGPRFDEAALLAAGHDPRDLEALRERIDAIALERLYLRDAADREGWRGTRRWRRERRELDDELFGIREEFGDDLYDWGMYASGQANRVKVADVLRGSAAAEAGIMAGDVIVSYGDRRIFRIRDLRDGTRAGRPGEMTELRVLRDGIVHRVFLPRGPIGVTPEPIVLQPPPR